MRAVRSLRDWYRDTQHFLSVSYQRIRYGVAEQDAWGFDMHSAKVIARAVRQISDGLSYPGDDQFPDHESWRAYLIGIAEPLEEYADSDSIDSWFYSRKREDHDRVVGNAKAALHRFADRFDSMWD